MRISMKILGSSFKQKRYIISSISREEQLKLTIARQVRKYVKN